MPIQNCCCCHLRHLCQCLTSNNQQETNTHCDKCLEKLNELLNKADNLEDLNNEELDVLYSLDELPKKADDILILLNNLKIIDNTQALADIMSKLLSMNDLLNYLANRKKEEERSDRIGRPLYPWDRGYPKSWGIPYYTQRTQLILPENYMDGAESYFRRRPVGEAPHIGESLSREMGDAQYSYDKYGVFRAKIVTPETFRFYRITIGREGEFFMFSDEQEEFTCALGSHDILQRGQQRHRHNTPHEVVYDLLLRVWK